MESETTRSKPLPVLIIGAGPVGLLLANLLGQRGIRCQVIEQRAEFPDWSRAIGVTPPSLGILETVGLDTPLIERGVQVEKAYVHDDRGIAATVSFTGIDSDFRFILSVPQCDTMQILGDNLAKFDCVEIRRGMKLTALTCRDDRVDAEIESRRLDQGTSKRELRPARGTPNSELISCSWLIGCDGADSTVRDLAGLDFDRKPYSRRFVMADYRDTTTWGSDAHLFFRRRGSLESFPLPDGRRRWVALLDQASARNAPELFLEKKAFGLSGQTLDDTSRTSPPFEFVPEKMTVERLFKGRVILAGDAAHVISPIGGQGMNSGFADVELLSLALPRLIAGEAAEPLLQTYDRARQRAATAARRRAAFGMWVGTRTGGVPSALRNLGLRAFMATPLRRLVPPHFAMLTIPFNRAGKVGL